MALALALATGCAGCAVGEPDRWSASPGTEWQIVLGAEPGAAVTVVDGVAVYELDGAEASPEQVAALSESGARTICYVNAGAWEDWRDDADAFPAEVIGAAYPGWPGERFLDVRRLDVLGPLMEARLDACARAGFDAVEADNIDSYDAETGFELTRADAVAYALWWADAAHERGLAVGQKNAPALAGDLAGEFDFAVTEDCAADGWCAQLGPYLDAGAAVFAIEYTDRTGAAQFADFCADPDLSGLSLVLKNRELDEWRASCG